MRVRLALRLGTSGSHQLAARRSYRRRLSCVNASTRGGSRHGFTEGRCTTAITGSVSTAANLLSAELSPSITCFPVRKVARRPGSTALPAAQVATRTRAIVRLLRQGWSYASRPLSHRNSTSGTFRQSTFGITIGIRSSIGTAS